MIKNGMECLMLKNGSMPKRYSQNKKILKKTRNSIQVEISNLENGLYRLIFDFFTSYPYFYAQLFILVQITTTISLLISFFIAVSIICFSSLPILRYKLLIFIKHKKRISS
ncbi:hypothetical protein BHE89_19430 [Shigella sp. FC1967]|nr:hypothetical protein BHE89_19430 [Shigella sp. FC1967]